MAQAAQKSAIEELFGKNAYYPERRPSKKVQMEKRSWRLWHRFTAVWLLLPIWLAVLLVPVTMLSGDDGLWVAEAIGSGLWFFSGLMVAESESLTKHDHRYLPGFWRGFHGVDGSYSEGEERVLEAIWSLTDAVDRLAPVAEKLTKQLSSEDEKRIQGFSDEARQALARGDQALAQSLLEAKADAEEHQQWVKEQLERLEAQLQALRGKRYHLMTRLATHHMRQEALKAQTDANQARASTLEALAGTPLEAEFDAGDLDLLKLKDEALDAEARVLALEELGQELPALPAAALDGKDLEQAFAALETHVAIERASRVS